MTDKFSKSDSFDPNSLTALLATILVRLDSQEAELNRRFSEQGKVLERIEEQTTLTNGRVTKLEKWRDSYVARASGIALAASVGASGLAWVVSILMRK